ncbi:monovalent cation/H+ antiporter complex subunit F [Candidatus Solirubrobacter pratensis]|uniref:monovalent cation/H+ antiporter complex subunit F n=1 Tax=Candidatus Solirubrobacter pratensis TaxID=1298857 RepID=UPI0004116CFE|nr:monovalent cation/H+ antiporter complex subunit F [Candidatus Solirubrobacter pratensis]
MNEWLWAAAVLTLALAALVLAAVRRPLLEGLVALEAAGVDATLVMLLIAVGTKREPFGDLALILGLTSFAGSLAFLRFGRRLG